MAQIRYSAQALTDLERISDFLIPEGSDLVLYTLDLIEEAVSILARHPMIGRTVNASLRELVISRGKTGYVALYSYESAEDTVLVHAIRHQREAGFQQHS
jgi:plasmid stabilization system protein ParE